MASGLTQCMDQKRRGGVDHLRLLSESRSGRNKPGDLENASNAPEIAQLRLELRQGLEHAGFCGPLGLLQAYFGPCFTGHHHLPLRAWDLAADVGHAPMYHD